MNQIYLLFMEPSDYRYPKPRKEMIGCSVDCSFPVFEVSIETLMEDIKLVSTGLTLNNGMNEY